MLALDEYSFVLSFSGQPQINNLSGMHTKLLKRVFDIHSLLRDKLRAERIKNTYSVYNFQYFEKNFQNGI